MWSITMQMMKKNVRMLIPAGIAVLIGTAFIAATLLFSNALDASMTETQTVLYGDANYAVTPAQNAPDSVGGTGPRVARSRSCMSRSLIWAAVGAFTSATICPSANTIARQNILMPLTLAGKKPDVQWFDLLVRTLGLSDRLSHHPNEHQRRFARAGRAHDRGEAALFKGHVHMPQLKDETHRFFHLRHDTGRPITPVR